MDERNTIRTMAELEVNRDLELAFLGHLQIAADGMDRADRKETEAIIADCRRKSPAEWSSEAKKELLVFLFLRAGFTLGEGYAVSGWMEGTKCN